jgi:error-prone DNA polymerase
VLAALWQQHGIETVHEQMAVVPEGFGGVGLVNAGPGAAESRSSRPVMASPQTFGEDAEAETGHYTAGGMGRRRVLVHSSGFQVSPYSDIKPAGEDTKEVARKLWHRSPGSPG